MKETPFYFRNGRSSLFGVLHEPKAQPLSSFVFCHPFGEEKLWAHRVFVWFARSLAEQGHAVLRFDYMGNGDSQGDFHRSSLTTARSDTGAAIGEIRRITGATQVNLVGLRFGAIVASLVAEETANVDRLILWAPIIDGGRYMQELLRINLTTQMSSYKEIRQDREAMVDALKQGSTVNVDGYEMAFALYSEVSAVNLATYRKQHAGACLIVQVDRNTKSASAELQQLSTTYERATLKLAAEEPFWKEIAQSYQRPASSLFTVTLDWFQSQ